MRFRRRERGPAPRRSQGAGVVGVERFRARSAAWRSRRTLAWLGGITGVALVAAVVWALGFSTLTALEEVRVEGVEGALAEEVAATAQAPVGTPLIRVDLGALTERTQGLRDLASVQVSREWPRTVVIDAEPRQAQAAVSDGERWWRVDAGGVLFGDSAEAPADVPVIDASASEEDADVRGAAIAVLQSLPEPLAEQVRQVRAASLADVRLELADDAEVLWGSVEQSEEKARVLQALIAAQEDTPRAYDVSAPSRPAVEP